MELNPYRELANAIIMQAVNDYRQNEAPYALTEIERFFLSDWFHVLTKIDGEWLLQKLRKEKAHER